MRCSPTAAKISAELFGSLGATGHGHGSDKAVLLGLAGEDPETVDVDTIAERVAVMTAAGGWRVLGSHDVEFDLVLHRRRSLPFHPNGMIFTALRRGRAGRSGSARSTRSAAASSSTRPRPARTGSSSTRRRWHIRSAPASSCSRIAPSTGLPISDDHAGQRDCPGGPRPTSAAGSLHIWQVMQDCVDKGCATERRAARRPEGAPAGRRTAPHAGVASISAPTR